MREISYDVFVLALIISSKPVSMIRYHELSNILKKIAAPVIIENSPLIPALLTDAGLAFKVDLNLNFSALGFKFLLMLLKSSGVFISVEFLRSTYFINCSDYVVKLSETDIKELTHCDKSPELDPSCSSSLKISYTCEYPTRHDTYVSTSPNSKLYYQEDVQKFETETLDGTVKEIQKVNGEKSVNWFQNRENKQSRKPKYIPL